MGQKLQAVRILVLLFITVLVISGLTAIPLVAEANALVQLTNAHEHTLEPGSTLNLVRGYPIWFFELRLFEEQKNSKRGNGVSS